MDTFPNLRVGQLKLLNYKLSHIHMQKWISRCF